MGRIFLSMKPRPLTSKQTQKLLGAGDPVPVPPSLMKLSPPIRARALAQWWVERVRKSR